VFDSDSITEWMMYGGSTETRFARDVEQVPAWVRGGRREPGTVGEAAF
jgi:hypothetical protein